jgi:hypothetical protein
MSAVELAPAGGPADADAAAVIQSRNSVQPEPGSKPGESEVDFAKIPLKEAFHLLNVSNAGCRNSNRLCYTVAQCACKELQNIRVCRHAARKAVCLAICWLLMHRTRLAAFGIF